MGFDSHDHNYYFFFWVRPMRLLRRTKKAFMGTRISVEEYDEAKKLLQKIEEILPICRDKVKR
jgi:hypothetical protein